ncbi:MAG: hypothetical protein ABJB98_09920 [Actinomycetota bacterium]
MTSAAEASIVPITLTVNGRIGLTLWAPPWEDDDGEEWHGFLGDGAKIVLFPNARELADFVASGEENDLSDHPAWGRVQKLAPDQFRPDGQDAYDLDQVYEWASGEPDPVHVSSLANVVDMVTKIADCCDDGALRQLVASTPEYADLVSDDVSYQGKEGRRAWNQLGDVIAETWERAITRVESWLAWRGDFSTTDLDADTIWDRVGAEPIELVFPDVSYLTVRGELDDEVLFLGNAGTVAVFSEATDLGRYCRTAQEHELTRLERWGELAETDPELDAEIFTPALDASYDLTKPSTRGGALLRELADFCELDADEASLSDPIDGEAWSTLVAEVQTCLQPQD